MRTYSDYIQGIPLNLQMSRSFLATMYTEMFLSDGGTFVEVGAFDGWSWSHTLCLAKLGWRGLYIEPVPGHALLCADCHKDHPNVTTICCACGAEEMSSRDLYIKDATSSLVLNAVSDVFGLTKDNKIEVSVRTLDSILQENKVKHIDVLVVDVEGFEIEVLKGFSIDKYPPRLAIIETHELSGKPFKDERGVNHISVFCDDYFSQNGYKKIFADDCNTFYLRA